MSLRLLAKLAAAGATLVGAKVCSMSDEDCTHSACCAQRGFRCYKKNGYFAGCRENCTPGLHIHDPEEYRTPWSCDLIDEQHPDCATDASNCIHLGCCKSKNHRCILKNAGEAFCMASIPPGWIGHEIKAHRPSQQPPDANWQYGLHSTHHWDCRGQSCDAPHLHPRTPSKFVSPPEYAPMNPGSFGGRVYGEKIWMLGAASDALASMLGPDINKCGTDNGGGGGCGQCILIKNSAANKQDWTAVVMKKSRCLTGSPGCGEGELQMNVAIPGYADRKQGNACGNHGTTLSKQQSDVCRGATPEHCDCSLIKGNTAALQRMREGCELFKAWGWQSSNPTLDWRPVDCPPQFVEPGALGWGFWSRWANRSSWFKFKAPCAPGHPCRHDGGRNGCCGAVARYCDLWSSAFGHATAPGAAGARAMRKFTRQQQRVAGEA